MHKSKCVQPADKTHKIEKGEKQAELKMLPKPIEHEIITLKDGLFLCPYKDCQHSYKDRSGLQKHYRVTHLGHRDVCPKCDIQLTQLDSHHKRRCKGSADALLRYVSEWHPRKDGRYNCPYGSCSSSFTSSDGREAHFRSQHMGNPNVNLEEDPKEIREIEYSNRKNESSEFLKEARKPEARWEGAD